MSDNYQNSAAPPPQGQQPISIEEGLSIASQLQASGRLGEAERIYRQILQADPGQPVALQRLGVIAHLAGHSDVAINQRA